MIVDKVKELRKSIDGTADAIRNIQQKPADKNSYELNQAVRNLLFGKAWLGKVLAELDVPSPYPNDGTRKSVKDIEPTADKQLSAGWDKNLNHIERVDKCRQIIEDYSKQIKDLELPRGTWAMNVARTNAYTYICEARFCLGFELESIKNAGK